MLTYGRIPFNLKKQFIKDKESNPEPQETPPSNGPSPPPSEQDEEHFKIVRNKLKLNQSAITPNKQDVASQKLEDLAQKSDKALLQIKTVWPFTLFVHRVFIDPYKVTIVFKNFFWSEHIHSVMIRDVLDVEVETSILFATLKIVDQGYTESSIGINYLWKSEAKEARKIIQGLVLAHRQGVDLSKSDADEIKSNIEKMGEVKEIDGSEENIS